MTNVILDFDYEKITGIQIFSRDALEFYNATPKSKLEIAVIEINTIERQILNMVKLLIWGTGNLAKKFINNGYKGELLGFVETNKSSDIYMGKPIYGAYQLPDDYDYIIIANSYVSEIFKLCLQIGIDRSKLVFLYGRKERLDQIDMEIIKEILQEKIMSLTVQNLRSQTKLLYIQMQRFISQ